MAKACVYLCHQCFATLVVFGGLGEFLGEFGEFTIKSAM